MKKQCSGFSLVLLFIIILTGCATNEPAVPVAGSQSVYLSVADGAGRTVIIPKKPERIVPLSSSFIELLYAVGGKAAGKPSSTISNLPEAAKDLPEVGHVANISTERLLALQPDLVIGYQGMHEKLVPLMESSKVPFIIIKIKTYEDVINTIKLLGAIAGPEKQARKVAEDLEQRIEAVVAKLPDTTKKVVILHATARSVTVQLAGSIAGSVADILKLQNIATDRSPLGENADSLPFSMEKIVERDPDIILIAFTGNLAANEKRLQDEVQSNPAWSELRAVRSKQVFFLPMELFLLNPGIRYDEAVLYMAKLIYPEIYGPI